MKRRLEQKNDFSLIEMILVNGIQKINVQNYGIFSMETILKESTLELFLSVTGRNWMSGIILHRENIEIPSLVSSS